MSNEIPVAWPDEHIKDACQRITKNCLARCRSPSTDGQVFGFHQPDIVEVVLNKG